MEFVISSSSNRNTRLSSPKIYWNRCLTFGRGIAGFLVAAIILYVTKFIVPGFNISLWGAIIGALVIGVVDAIMPGRAI